MPKAIKITVSSMELLANNHDVDLDDLVFFEGSYLITGFGGDVVNGFMSESNIKKFFNITEINCEEQSYTIEKRERIKQA